ncbi:ERF family protein [Bartonella sp. ML70XJBT.G]|uniref:ERF family protein n=1 Tax=Bartonella sp. ML70XJBT.G TaxID=3019093 RepID=UPI00235DE23B|nr:ERF family protein [Bartonella sp. ML70XJBT.G]
MNELNTTKTELIKKTSDCRIKPTAMELILDKRLKNDIDMDRLECLIALREKERERQSGQNFDHDLSAIQMEYQEIQKNATNTHTNSQYTTLDQYIDTAKDILSKYHFTLFFCIKEQSADSVIIEMTLKHSSGKNISIEGRFSLDVKGRKLDILSVGSTITYAQRYLLSMLLNVASKEDVSQQNDTDGNKPIKKASPRQINEIRTLIEQTQSQKAKELNYIKVKKLDDMFDRQAQMVLHLLKEKQKTTKQQFLPQQEQIDAPIQDAQYFHIQDIEYVSTQQKQQMAV